MLFRMFYQTIVGFKLFVAIVARECSSFVFGHMISEVTPYCSPWHIFHTSS